MDRALVLLVQLGAPAHLLRHHVLVAAAAEQLTNGLSDFALADKLWKGKRVAKLEQRVIASLTRSTGAPAWKVFLRTDPVFESVAERGDARLARSHG